MATKVVKADARNRALRTLVQGLFFDMAAAFVIVLYTAFSAANAWGDLEWSLVGFTVVKSGVVAGLSYLMRTVFASQMPPEGSE